MTVGVGGRRPSRCLKCHKDRRDRNEEWYRVQRFGGNGGSNIGTVAQYCADCWGGPKVAGNIKGNHSI